MNSTILTSQSPSPCLQQQAPPTQHTHTNPGLPPLPPPLSPPQPSPDRGGLSPSLPSTSIVDRELSGWLLAALTSPDPAARSAAADCYLRLSCQDWLYLLGSDGGHLEALVERGRSAAETKAKVRSDATKALGGMVVKVLSGGEEAVEAGTTVAAAVSEALLAARDEPDDNVRCMVLLAAGNLGQGLTRSGAVMEAGVWLNLCEVRSGEA